MRKVIEAGMVRRGGKSAGSKHGAGKHGRKKLERGMFGRRD
jgi:hypothetical protein